VPTLKEPKYRNCLRCGTKFRIATKDHIWCSHECKLAVIFIEENRQDLFFRALVDQQHSCLECGAPPSGLPNGVRLFPVLMNPFAPEPLFAAMCIPCKKEYRKNQIGKER
jgi:hypothetical protein